MRTTGLIRLTHDPDIKIATVDDGERSVCTMRCAIRLPRGKDAGFVDVVTWGRLAEVCATHLSAGDPAFVDGHLRQHEWTDGDGNRHQRHRIVADDVQFLSGGRKPDEPEIEF